MNFMRETRNTIHILRSEQSPVYAWYTIVENDKHDPNAWWSSGM